MRIDLNISLNVDKYSLCISGRECHQYDTHGNILKRFYQMLSRSLKVYKMDDRYCYEKKNQQTRQRERKEHKFLTPSVANIHETKFIHKNPSEGLLNTVDHMVKLSQIY